MRVHGEACFLILSSCLFLVRGASIEPVETENGTVEDDDCSRPPVNKDMVSCCVMPKQHLLGSVRETLWFCTEKMKDNRKSEEEEGGLSTPSPSPSPPTEEQGRRRHHFRRYFRDGCFMECVFERLNLLVENKVNKDALLERIQASLSEDENWQGVAREGTEECLSHDLECPFWLADNEYCGELREFYHRCPNGPPPEIPGKNRRHRYRTRSTQEEDIEESDNNDDDANEQRKH